MNELGQYEQMKRVGLRSTSGPKDLNEDSAYIKDYSVREEGQRYLCLGAVAGGMGGKGAGEVASTTAIKVLFEQFNAHRRAYSEDTNLDSIDLLYKLFSAVNSSVYELAVRSNRLRRMGTTLTAFLAERAKVYIAHVGNTRAYLIRENSINQLTEDHVRREEHPEGPARRLITRAIGLDQAVDVDILTVEVAPGDILLLCSDGLSDTVSDEEMLRTISGATDMQAACRELVRLAVHKGTRDNVTAVAWVVPGAVPAEATAGRRVVASLLPLEEATPQVPKESVARDGLKRAKPKRWHGKLLFGVILALVIAAGFGFGWVLAGWVKGEKREAPGQENTLVGTAEEKEGEAGGQTEMGISREGITLTVLNAKGKSGLAEKAKSDLESLGYINVKTGNAANDTKTIIYYSLGSREKAMQVVEDLGITPPFEENSSVALKYGTNVVLVLAEYQSH